MLRSRLVQFLALGGLIFVLTRHTQAPSVIQMESSDSGSASGTLSRLDAHRVEDEVLYREALRLGLDQGDPLIRRHLVQKMILLAEDLGGAGRAPTPNEVAAYFEANRARWVRDASVHFIHVFGQRQETLAELHLADDTREPPHQGDAFPNSRDVRQTEAEMVASFGSAFVDGLRQIPEGHWSDALPSKYGWHRVKILERTPGHLPSLEEVRGQVVLDCSAARRKQAVQLFLERALLHYRVELDGRLAPPFEPVGRLGLRSEPSAEDQ
jgi:hypothetical protein